MRYHHNSAFPLAILLTAFSAMAPTSFAATHTLFQRGDLFVGGRVPLPFESYGRFDWFLSDGSLNMRLTETYNEYPYDSAFDRSGRLYVPTSAGVVRRYAADGTFADDFGPHYQHLARSIAFDAVGSAYVVGGTATGNLVKLDALGSVLKDFNIQPQPIFIDLAADQCTIYFIGSAKNTSILRYDVCQSRSLPDLTSSLPGYQAYSLRILGDGSVLVADAQAIHRLDRSGAIVQTYSVPGEDFWFSLALDVDGQSFWAAPARGRFYKFDIATGRVIAGPISTSDYDVLTIGVVGEPRAAIIGAPESIPTLAEWMLAALAVALVVAGVVRVTSFGS